LKKQSISELRYKKKFRVSLKKKKEKGKKTNLEMNENGVKKKRRIEKE
jgi:hypothetical protein